MRHLVLTLLLLSGPAWAGTDGCAKSFTQDTSILYDDTGHKLSLSPEQETFAQTFLTAANNWKATCETAAKMYNVGDVYFHADGLDPDFYVRLIDFDRNSVHEVGGQICGGLVKDPNFSNVYFPDIAEWAKLNNVQNVSRMKHNGAGEPTLFVSCYKPKK